jgi:HEAT repeat protein
MSIRSRLLLAATLIYVLAGLTSPRADGQSGDGLTKDEKAAGIKIVIQGFIEAPDLEAKNSRLAVLGELGPAAKEAVKPIQQYLEQLLKEGRANSRYFDNAVSHDGVASACYALGMIGTKDDKVVDLLIDVMRNTAGYIDGPNSVKKTPNCRFLCAQALGMLASPKAIPYLAATVLDDDDDEVRMAAREALKKNRDKSATKKDKKKTK